MLGLVNWPKGKKLKVQQLISLLPDELLEGLGQELSVDKWAKKLKAHSLFKLILFSVLNSERLSLRIMEQDYVDPMFRVLAPSLIADQITWTGIRARLMQINALYFERLYEHVYQQAELLYGQKALHGYHIKRYDSTMIGTFSHLIEGMRVGNSSLGKVQIKLTTSLKDAFLIQMQLYQDQAHLSEERALKHTIEQQSHSPEDIIVFDKGLKSRESFADFEQHNIQFVTRLQKQARYELLHPYSDPTDYLSEDLEFIQDSVVHLYKDGHRLVKTKFRLIECRVRKDGSTLQFLTNLWDLPAPAIARIYRQRWDIEVLFRFLKQEMNLTHFVCNDLNAIKVMMYTTLIAAMLVLIYKQVNGIKSYKKAKIQFFKELLFSSLEDIIQSPQGWEWFKNNLNTFNQRE